jgi:hypothetical protein
MIKTLNKELLMHYKKKVYLHLLARAGKIAKIIKKWNKTLIGDQIWKVIS